MSETHIYDRKKHCVKNKAIDKRIGKSHVENKLFWLNKIPLFHAHNSDQTGLKYWLTKRFHIRRTHLQKKCINAVVCECNYDICLPSTQILGN